jgi:hypothetical protein
MRNLSRWRGKKTNPIQTQFLQRPKSLAGKSGHTLSERIFAKYLNLGTIAQ